MSRRTFRPAVLALLATSIGLGATPPLRADTATDTATAPTVTWRPHTGVAMDGSPIEGELGRIRVPEDRARPGGPTIELTFVRYRTDHPEPGPPIVFLAGGPGGSGVELAARRATHPQLRLLEHADVIGLDQRGTGASGAPLAAHEIIETLPTDRAATRADVIAAVRRAARATAAHWRREGVDLGAYTTEASAEDLDDVRRALGLEQIVLDGASYGSHLALAYLRRHGRHVARALLFNVEGPDDTWKLPATTQAHLAALAAMVEGDPALAGTLSDLESTLGRLLEQLGRQPVQLEAGGDGAAAVVVGPLDLQVFVARALGSTATIASLPAALARCTRGDWSDLGDTARDLRRVGVHAMALAMDCASGASDARWRSIVAQTADAAHLLGDALFAPFYPEACTAAGIRALGDAFREPFQSNVPILFTSGSMDVRTPSSNVEALLPGFRRGTHLIATHASHDSRELMSPEYRLLVQAFLRGEAVTGTTIRLPEPIFDRIGDEAETVR